MSCDKERINITVNRKKWDGFVKACKEYGMNGCEALEVLIESFVKEKGKGGVLFGN